MQKDSIINSDEILPYMILPTQSVVAFLVQINLWNNFNCKLYMKGSKRNIRQRIHFPNLILALHFCKYYKETSANKISIYCVWEELENCIFNQVGGYRQTTEFHTEKV
jgi:hypothetical protein